MPRDVPAECRQRHRLNESARTVTGWPHVLRSNIRDRNTLAGGRSRAPQLGRSWTIATVASRPMMALVRLNAGLVAPHRSHQALRQDCATRGIYPRRGQAGEGGRLMALQLSHPGVLAGRDVPFWEEVCW
jgi:hypothetical protein